MRLPNGSILELQITIWNLGGRPILRRAIDSLMQPTIKELFDYKQVQALCLQWRTVINLITIIKRNLEPEYAVMTGIKHCHDGILVVQFQ